MTRIVTTHYRYKRPPRKKRRGVALEVPTIVTAASKRSGVSRRNDTSDDAKAEQLSKLGTGSGSAPVAPADDRKSAIVTIRRKGRFGDVPDMTPEEHKRRGDAADALFRDIVRGLDGRSQFSGAFWSAIWASTR